MLTETELLEEIRRQALALGLLIDHHQDSRRDHLFSPGFPDLVIASRFGRGILPAEVKSPGGQLSRGQQIWRRAFEANGLPYLVLRESALHSGEIRARLQLLAS